MAIYVNSYYLSISNGFRTNEIHGELIAVIFRNGESRYLRGDALVWYYEEFQIPNWLSMYSSVIIDRPNHHGNIIFNKNFVNELKGILPKIYRIETVLMENLIFENEKEVKAYVDSLNSNPVKTIWNSEFN